MQFVDVPPDPLAASSVWPNYMQLVTYPLFNSNARILFTRQMNRQGYSTGIMLPRKVGLFTNVDVLRQVCEKETIFAMYIGLPMYVAHGFARDAVRGLLADRLCKNDRDYKVDTDARRKRLALKYVAEFASFPILYVATRQIVSHVSLNPFKDLVDTITEAYAYGGLAVFWTGALPHVVSSALEDGLNGGLDVVLNRQFGNALEANDRFVLKMTWSVLVSCFTAPFVTWSVSRRVSGGGPNFPDVSPWHQSIGDVTVGGFMFQVVLFSALFGVNLALIDAKKNEDRRR